MFKLFPDRAQPQRPLSPGRVHRVTRAASAMERVPSDREARLIELLVAFQEVKIDLVLDPPDVFTLRTLQSMADRAIAEYDR